MIRFWRKLSFSFNTIEYNTTKSCTFGAICYSARLSSAVVMAWVSPWLGGEREREREMFYLTTHSTHFIYGYMASDIWLRTILIVRKETRCRHIGYSYRLTARVLLYAPSHRQDNTYHGLCYTSRGALAGARNSSMGPPHEGSIRRPTAPWANALPLSYVPLPGWGESRCVGLITVIGYIRNALYDRDVNLYGLSVSRTDVCDLHGLTGVPCNPYGYMYLCFLQIHTIIPLFIFELFLLVLDGRHLFANQCDAHARK